jgi:hypothetical protein
MPRVGHFHWASRAVTMSLRIAFRTLSKFNHFSGFSDYLLSVIYIITPLLILKIDLDM